MIAVNCTIMIGQLQSASQNHTSELHSHDHSQLHYHDQSAAVNYSQDHSLFVCLCWGFTAQSTQSGHVEHSQFTLPHLYWAGLVL